MNIASLRAFHAVATAGGFSAAADRLGRTQSTITIMVDKLEQEYGVELVIRRRGKFISLTRTGEEVMRSASLMFGHENDIQHTLKNAGRLIGGKVRIGSTAPNSMIRIVSRVRERFPQLEFLMSHSNSEIVLSDLYSCRIDIGIVGGIVDDPELLIVPFQKPEIVLVGTASQIPENNARISRKEFAEKTLILRESGSQTRFYVLNHLEKYSHNPKNILEISTREGCAYAAAAGLGVAAISDLEIPVGMAVNVGRFDEFTIMGVNSLCMLKTRSHSLVLKRVMEIALLD